MNISIPFDLYESQKEIVIIMPVGGVSKQSIDLSLSDYKLVIKGKRMIPKLRDDLQMIKEECYRGDFEQILELPSHVYFDKIHSTLTAENILMITVPKVIQPEKISIKVQYE